MQVSNSNHTQVTLVIKKNAMHIDRCNVRPAVGTEYYLVRQRLRRRVADPTAICDTGDFCCHFQNVSQGQIGDVSIIRSTETQGGEG